MNKIMTLAYLHEFSSMNAAHDSPTKDFVALGHHIFHLDVVVRQKWVHGFDIRSKSFPTWFYPLQTGEISQASERNVGRKNIRHQIKVLIIPELSVVAANYLLVGFRRRAHIVRQQKVKVTSR